MNQTTKHMVKQNFSDSLVCNNLIQKSSILTPFLCSFNPYLQLIIQLYKPVLLKVVTTQQGTVLRSRNPSVVGGVDGLSALLRGPHCCAWTTLPAAGLQGSPKSSMRSQKQIKKQKRLFFIQLSSVQFNRSVMSNSLQPHGLQYARPPCPSPTPRVYSDSRPLSR